MIVEVLHHWLLAARTTKEHITHTRVSRSQMLWVNEHVLNHDVCQFAIRLRKTFRYAEQLSICEAIECMFLRSRGVVLLVSTRVG